MTQTTGINSVQTPVRVIVAGVLQIILSLFYILGGIGFAAMGPQLFAGSGNQEIVIILVGLGVFVACIGVFLLVLSVFVFKLANWARMATFIVLAILCVLGFLSFILGNPEAIVQTILAALTIMLLVNEQSKTAFMQAKYNRRAQATI